MLNNTRCVEIGITGELWEMWVKFTLAWTQFWSRCNVLCEKKAILLWMFSFTSALNYRSSFTFTLSSLLVYIFIYRVLSSYMFLMYSIWIIIIIKKDQFDLCQNHSSNWHLQWKSMGFHLYRHIVLRPLGLGAPNQTCGHLR